MNAVRHNMRGVTVPHHASQMLRENAHDEAKGSFKLTLLETVAADPTMKPADLALMVAYCTMLQWPKRRAWLAGSQARARTGLSERQVNISRKRLIERGYFIDRGRQGVSRLFELVNPRADDMRMHVHEAAEHYREETRERQVKRRVKKAVTANSAGTILRMSHSHGASDNTAENAGNIPSYTLRI